MFELLFPKQHLNNIFELDPQKLKELGIKGIIADMDNTLVPWNDRTVQPRLAGWLAGLKEKGFQLCIVSNNTADKGGELARQLDIPAFWYAVKPRRRAFRKALREMNLAAEEVAVVGDQIFTDVLGGNRMGLYTILVTPISDKEFFWTKLMRQLERLVLNYLKRHNMIH
ncbi:MAG TPA: YqeG family HAD IIIA-type phosphatase [Bacillota bacterium]|nr:YqeG family HAD IIIA-type phosphatase [Bacillota bacterium]